MKKMFSLLFVCCLSLFSFASSGLKDSSDRELRKGYQLVVEYGGGRWETQLVGSYLGSAYLLNAYRFNPYVSLGLGIELDYRNGFTSLPVEIACRINTSKRKQALFFSGSLGYNLNGEGSPCIGAGVGVRFRLSHKLSLLLHLNYHVLRNRYAKPWENFHYMEHYYMLRLGFSF
jgi:hypothetical protein